MSKSIVWSDSNFNNGVARIINGLPSVEEAKRTIATLKERGEIPEDVTPSIVDTEGNISKDRSLRDAWVADTTSSPNALGVREGLAQAVSLARVRANRDALLLELDKEYLIATRIGSDTVSLDARRQKLLDATEALKALDVNQDGIISVEEAAAKFLPLELVEV